MRGESEKPVRAASHPVSHGSSLLPCRGRLVRWLLVAWLAASALVPSSLHPVAHFPPFYAHTMTLLTTVIGALALAWNVLASRTGVTRRISILSVCLLGMASVGVTANDHAVASWLCLIWPMLVFVSAPALAARLVEWGLPDHHRMLQSLATAVTAIAIIYALASVVAPQLGFRGGVSVSLTETRVRGPLANSATIYVALLPTAAFWASQVRQKAKHAVPKMLANMAVLALTFSRAALACATLWLVWFFLSRLGRRGYRRTALAAVVCAVGAIVVAVTSSGLVARLASLDDPYRRASYQSGVEAFLASPLVGQGFSHVWPWWQRQGELVAGLRQDRWDGLWVTTDYGESLWNPHSLAVLAAAELGVVGALVVAAMLATPFVLGSGRVTATPVSVALILVGGSDALLGGSFYAFPELACIWWLYAFLQRSTRSQVPTPVGAWAGSWPQRLRDARRPVPWARIQGHGRIVPYGHV